MKYFTLKELTRSETAERLGIDNRPPTDAVVALIALVDNVLDPARAAMGAPVRVTSGYRSPRLNQAVGGAPNSQHTLGEAADVAVATEGGNVRLARVIYDNGVFDQLILEDANGDATRCRWVHVSYSKTGNRRQVLIKYKGKSGYAKYDFA